MARLIALLPLLALPLLGCGPDKRACSRPSPAFVLLLELADRPLASDTVVNVTYGGTGKDQYELAKPGADHQVIFCTPSTRGTCGTPDPSSTGELGEAGAAGSSGESGQIEALCCNLWTGGFTHLEVHATGIETAEYDLYPNEDQCSVEQRIVLDSPDGG